MKIKEVSCGIVPFRQAGEEWQVFLVRMHEGHWGFPKGHIHNLENHHRCAMRELHEETGLNVINLLSETPMREHYTYLREGIEVLKEVFYFPALVEGEVDLQEDEIAEGGWFPLQEARERITFHESRRVLDDVLDFIPSS